MTQHGADTRLPQYLPIALKDTDNESSVGDEIIEGQKEDKESK